MSFLNKKTLIVLGVILVSSFGLYYANASTAATQDDTQNQQNNLRDQQTWLKNLKNEVQRAKKDIKGSFDFTKADTLLGKFETCLSARQQEIGTPDFWTNMQDCNNAGHDADVELNESVRPASGCVGSQKNFADRKREKKNNVDSGIKNILKNDKSADVSSLQNLANQIDAVLTKFDAFGSSCSKDISDQMKDMSKELDGFFQDFYSLQNDLSRASDTVRRLNDDQKDFDKNLKKNCEKDKTRELNKLEKELARSKTKNADNQAAFDKAKELYTSLCVTLIGSMQDALKARDVDAFDTARNEYGNSDREFWDTLNNASQSMNDKENHDRAVVNVTRDLQQKSKDLARMKKDLARMKTLYAKTASKYANAADRKEALDAFAGFISQAADLIGKIEDGLKTAVAQASSDPDEYWNDHNDEVQDLQNEFNDLQQKVQMIGNVMQGLKDGERGINMYQKNLKNIAREAGQDSEVIATLTGLVDQAREALKQAWSLAITDPEQAMSTLENTHDLQQQWDETVNNWRDSQGE